MDTATTARPPAASASPDRPPDRFRRLLVAGAGPALIVVSVLISLRGFAFLPRLTNQHPDLLTFWLPRSCLLGDALADGRMPLWNPFEMAGTPFAADTQSGWLAIAPMLSSWVLGCGDGLRALIVLHPILAGLGLWWFLREEGLGRIPATAGGLSLAMTIAASSIAISLPFGGTLAWTPLVLVGASGFCSSRGWRRAGWLALGAVAWGQVAAAHLSHGLLMCTALVVAYLAARSIREVRDGALAARASALLGAGFLAFLPLANLAILVPRFSLLQRSSLRAGYGALEDTVVRVLARPIPIEGVWSGWPLALASTPGAYLGAAILLALPFALRDRGRRHLVIAFGALVALGYTLTLSALVGAGWFRSLVRWMPFGDVYLHNPGRLRFLAILAGPILGAIGLQAWIDRRPPLRDALPWLGVALAVFLVLPLVAGANAGRLVVFAIGSAAVVGVAWALGRGRRWAPLLLAGVLALELLGGALWSSAYQGGTVYLGLEGSGVGPLVHGPLRWPQVSLDRYLEPGRIALELRRRAATHGRHLAWVPPAAYFHKGYLFSQGERDWPALLLGRALLFRLHDALGYSPIQLPRYWSYIRATNRLPVFYNASVIQLPSMEDVRLLGIRYLIAHEGQRLPAGISGEVIGSEDGYLLYELGGWQPRVSLVPRWTVVDGAEALERVLERGFDPAAEAVVEGDPGIEQPAIPPTTPGTATYREERPEDVRIRVEASVPSLVLIRNAWDRGWSATVDGEPAPVLRTDHLLQAVPVTAGRHEVRLVYREPAIARGLAGSAVVWGLLLLGVAGATGVARRREATPRPAPPDA